MTFDPNDMPEPKRPEWATYIESRRPKFKLHSNRGLALHAASYLPRVCTIYRWDRTEEKWVEVFSGVVNDRHNGYNYDTCERCGASTKREAPFERRTPDGGWEHGVRMRNEGRWGWLSELDNKKKLVEPFKRAWLCTTCR